MKLQKRSVARVFWRVALATAVMFVLAGRASAQVTAGQNEVGGAVKVDTGDNEEWSLDVDTYYGRFVTNRWQVGPAWNIYKQGTSSAGAFKGFASYHFGDTSKTIVPYVQASLGRFYGQDDGNPSFVTAGPGVKMFVAGGGGALNISAVYRRSFDDRSRRAANGFALTVGASIFFK